MNEDIYYEWELEKRNQMRRQLEDIRANKEIEKKQIRAKKWDMIKKGSSGDGGVDITNIHNEVEQ